MMIVKTALPLLHAKFAHDTTMIGRLLRARWIGTKYAEQFKSLCRTVRTLKGHTAIAIGSVHPAGNLE